MSLSNHCRYESKITKNAKHFFVLKAGNHQVIGVSETYNSKAACDKGMAAVKKAAGIAAISDES